MATTPQSLHLINAASKQELKLIKSAGFYRINGDVVLGDLYRDPVDMHVAILLVTRKVPLEELPEVASLPKT